MCKVPHVWPGTPFPLLSSLVHSLSHLLIFFTFSLFSFTNLVSVCRVGHNTAEALAHIHLLTEFSTGFEICPVIGRSLTSYQSSKTGRQRVAVIKDAHH